MNLHYFVMDWTVGVLKEGVTMISLLMISMQCI